MTRTAHPVLLFARWDCPGRQGSPVSTDLCDLEGCLIVYCDLDVSSGMSEVTSENVGFTVQREDISAGRYLSGGFSGSGNCDMGNGINVILMLVVGFICMEKWDVLFERGFRYVYLGICSLF